MTHILVPIKDIEETIEILKEQNNICTTSTANFLEKILGGSKKISLDETDIVVNKDAKDIWVNQVSMVNDIEPINKRLILLEKSLNNIYDSAYKQALKDLL